VRIDKELMDIWPNEVCDRAEEHCGEDVPEEAQFFELGYSTWG